MEDSVSQVMVGMGDAEPQPPSSPSSESSSSPEGGGGKREDVMNHSDKARAQAGLYTAFFGKHRLQAAITNLHNEIRIIQEELELLETVGGSSIACKELIPCVELIPDPLLSVTKGPVDVNWDQWFRGAHNTRTHKRWI